MDAPQITPNDLFLMIGELTVQLRVLEAQLAQSQKLHSEALQAAAADPPTEVTADE